MSQATTETVTLNGVDQTTLFATLDAVKAQPEIAKFQFRARNRWVAGTEEVTDPALAVGAGQEMNHRAETVLDADHPAVLVGQDNGPTPVEYVLHALATCLTAGLVNIATARGVTLTEVESVVEGDINLLGILGLSDEERNGYEQVRVRFTIKGDADEETLRGLLERSRQRSAVFDIITNGVPVAIEANVG